MYTKEDFQEKIKNAMLARPQTALLYQAGDPRLLQIMDAQATMLAMLSQQIEVAMSEPFLKSRDATVLADAALKGHIFTAKPAVVSVRVANEGNNAVRLAAGRNVIDAEGRYYVILAPVTIAPKATAFISAEQVQYESQTHRVAETYPFYQVEIEPPKDGSVITTVAVKVGEQSFSPSYQFNGIGVDDKAFHVESDEFKRLMVKFGAYNILGYQPQNDELITIEKGLTFGDIAPKLSSPFSLQYIQHNDEHLLKMEMAELIKAGSNAADISVLRELGKYPSIYDKNAVFLGEFDLLLRSSFPNLAFLNVWNEAREEQVRGANVANINTLFVSFALPENANVTQQAVQNQIKSAIAKADDSYKLRFVPPVIEKITCQLTASIARIYNASQVESQIKDVLLAQYGKNAYAAKQGKVVVKNKEISELLKAKVPALADVRGDFFVNVATPRNANPEVFRFMDNQSITVNLNFDNYESNVWGGGYQ